MPVFREGDYKYRTNYGNSGNTVLLQALENLDAIFQRAVPIARLDDDRPHLLGLHI